MPDPLENAAAEEIASLRAEVARLREALEARTHSASTGSGLMKPDPELPGLAATWRGERGLAWQLFVQAAVTIIAGLAVLALVTIAGT